MGNLSEHFSEDEFRCKCGCGQVKTDPVLVAYLEILRFMIDAPIIITSGYRCHKHNLTVSPNPKSYHTQGRAADIYSPKIIPAKLFWYVENCPFGGIGFYKGKRSIHVDIRPLKKFQRWLKDEEGYHYLITNYSHVNPNPHTVIL